MEGTVIGIDQSVRHTGVCVLATDGTLKLLALIEPRQTDAGERLVATRDALMAILREHAPAYAVMEGYSYNSVNKKFLLGEVGAVVKMAVFDANATLYEAAPKQLKKFVTGKGSADKEKMKLAVKQCYHVELEDDNLADAYGLARIAVEIANTATNIRAQLEVVAKIKEKGLQRPRKRSTVKGLKGAL